VCFFFFPFLIRFRLLNWFAGHVIAINSDLGLLWTDEMAEVVRNSPMLSWLGAGIDEMTPADVSNFRALTRVTIHPIWYSAYSTSVIVSPILEALAEHKECNTVIDLPAYNYTQFIINYEQYVRYTLVDKYRKARENERATELDLFKSDCHLNIGYKSKSNWCRWVLD